MDWEATPEREAVAVTVSVGSLVMVADRVMAGVAVAGMVTDAPPVKVTEGELEGVTVLVMEPPWPPLVGDTEALPEKDTLGEEVGHWEVVRLVEGQLEWDTVRVVVLHVVGDRVPSSVCVRDTLWVSEWVWVRDMVGESEKKYTDPVGGALGDVTMDAVPPPLGEPEGAATVAVVVWEGVADRVGAVVPVAQPDELRERESRGEEDTLAVVHRDTLTEPDTLPGRALEGVAAPGPREGEEAVEGDLREDGEAREEEQAEGDRVFVRLQVLLGEEKEEMEGVGWDVEEGVVEGVKVLLRV